MERDLTKGNIVFTLAGFSLPLILSGVLQQLYNWADAFIVGNIEGELALAAVGATGTITNLFVMVITGLTLGLSILAAQKYGRGERESLRRILSTFSIVLGVLFLLTAAAGLWLSDGILRLLHTPEDIFDISEGYLRIILTGIPFITIYNVYSAVLRGLGDSRAPFLSVLVSAAANVILDLAFVGGLRMGAPGAAAATVISQALMTVFIVCYAGRKYEILRFSREEKLVDKKILVQGFQLGLPPAIQSSVNSCGNLLLQNFMNSFGTQTVAAITTAYRVDSILLLPIINLGSGISTVTAQNMGASDCPVRRDRGVHGHRSILFQEYCRLLHCLRLCHGFPGISGRLRGCTVFKYCRHSSPGFENSHLLPVRFRLGKYGDCLCRGNFLDSASRPLFGSFPVEAEEALWQKGRNRAINSKRADEVSGRNFVCSVFCPTGKHLLYSRARLSH